MRLVVIIPASRRMAEQRVPLEGDAVEIGGAAHCAGVVDHESVGSATFRFERHDEEWVAVDREGMGLCSVGGEPLRTGEPRIVRPPHDVRFGAITLSLVTDEEPFPTGLDTRQLAFEAVDRLALRAPLHGPRVRVVEGTKRGVTIDLVVGRSYLVGRADYADLRLVDPDVSREHLTVQWRGDVVVARHHGGSRASYLGGAKLAAQRWAVWRPTRMLRCAGAVLSLELPEDLAEILAKVGDGPPTRVAEPVVGGTVAAPIPVKRHATDNPSPTPEVAAEDSAATAASGAPIASVIAAPAASPAPSLKSTDSTSVLGAAVAAAVIVVLAIAFLAWILTI